MCQLNLADDSRNVALGTNAVSGVEWDGNTDKSFIIRYKGGDPDDSKKERYVLNYIRLPLINLQLFDIMAMHD